MKYDGKECRSDGGYERYPCDRIVIEVADGKESKTETGGTGLSIVGFQLCYTRRRTQELYEQRWLPIPTLFLMRPIRYFQGPRGMLRPCAFVSQMARGLSAARSLERELGNFEQRDCMESR